MAEADGIALFFRPSRRRRTGPAVKAWCAFAGNVALVVLVALAIVGVITRVS